MYYELSLLPEVFPYKQSKQKWKNVVVDTFMQIFAICIKLNVLTVEHVNEAWEKTWRQVVVSWWRWEAVN